jgi:hypothetical protein
MRKFLLLFAATLLSVSLSAETITGTSGDLTFNLNTETGVMNFDGEGAMADYANINDRPWSAYQGVITSVRFWGNPTAIGNKAFLNCDNLTACNFPSTLTRIGEQAFKECYELAGSVSLSTGLTSIGEKAFQYCEKITDFYLPSTLTSIGDYAFQGCEGVTYYIVSEDNPNFSTPGDVLCNKEKTQIIAYPTAHSRTTYAMPQTVTAIGKYAFLQATNLTSITLSSNLQTIGYRAFSNCTALTEITLPSTVTQIEDGAFKDCTGLTKIISEAQTPPTATYYSFDGVNLAIPVYVPAGTLSAYKVAEGWKRFTNIIGSMQCGDNLFAILSADGKTLTIEGTGDMWNYSYENPAPWSEEKENITAISLPDGLTSIGNYAFYYFYKVPAITLPSSLKRIGERGFYNCGALVTMDIPAGVTLIGPDAFVGCEAMTAYTVAAGNTAYCAENGVLFTKDKKILIQYPASKTGGHYEVPFGVEELVLRAIVNSNLQMLTLPASLLTMGEFAISSKNIQQIKSNASMPPVTFLNAFHEIYEAIPVYVPVGAKVRYEAATGWKRFTNIIEDASLGIEEPTSDSSLKGRGKKVLRDGVLLIENGDKTYNACGVEME